jgi:1,4-dihydroxy-2-naphthoyl-CoA hydrolase
MTFDQFIGMQHGDDNAEVTARIRIEPHHCNPTGNINGGVIISLADNISTGAANRAYLSKTGERKFMVGVDLHAVMLANQQGGTIRGVAVPVRVGRMITVIRTQVWGDDDKLLAEVTTTHVPT